MTRRRIKLDWMLLAGVRVSRVLVTPVGKSHYVGWKWGFSKKVWLSTGGHEILNSKLDVNIIFKFDRKKEMDDKKEDDK